MFAMKHNKLIIALSSVTATAYAGTPATVTAPPPAPAPSLCEWFVGGSFGQLYDVGNNLDSLIDNEIRYGGVDVEDLDMNMYTLHVGRGLTNQNGWDIAAYLEVAYLDGDMTISAFSSYQRKESTNIDFEMIPVTANLKVEHAIYGPVSGYLSGGLGYAWSRVSAEGEDANDGGFYAQLAAGLVYNVNESFEIFAGARWLYLDSVDFGDSTFELDNSFAWEAGLRFNF